MIMDTEMGLDGMSWMGDKSLQPELKRIADSLEELLAILKTEAKK